MDLCGNALVLRRCGDWQSLAGSEDRTVLFPRENMLDGKSLLRMMRLARKREAIR